MKSKSKYKIYASRSDLAIYYAWEYGVRYANLLMKDAEKVPGKQSHYYVKTDPSFNLRTREAQRNFLNRVKSVVVQFRAIKNKKLDNIAHVYPE